MSTQAQLLRKARDFLSKVTLKKAPEYQVFCPLELRKSFKQKRAEWPKWSELPGVYYVLGKDGSVLSIGVGTAWYGIVWKVEQTIKREHLPEKTRAGGILFDKSDLSWAFSLEKFLKHAIKPPLNIQRGPK